MLKAGFWKFIQPVGIGILVWTVAERCFGDYFGTTTNEGRLDGR